MDIEALSEDNFNAVSWINSTYKKSDQKDKEAFVSSIVSKVQLYVQQVNSLLEDTSQQVLTGLPRVMKDSQNLQNEILSLKSQLTEVQIEISQVQKDTGGCMCNLERLDTLTTKLQTAKQGLQESDGWGKLLLELEDLFERNDLMKICDKLHSLQKSLSAQEGLPGQNQRESQVEGFKNRLEALASPAVVQSFTHGEVAKHVVCKSCHEPVIIEVSRRVGLAAEVLIACSSCKERVSAMNSQQVIHTDENGKKSKVYDVNLRMVYGMRSIGCGYNGSKLFCGLMNLPAPHSRPKFHEKVVAAAVERVAKQSMQRAAREAIEIEGSKDIKVALDGTWQKRGHTSLNGVVSCTSIDNGKVLDVSIMSKYCMCRGRLSNNHEDNCTANYMGTSGGMEAEGAKQIFLSSLEKYGVRYTHYLGDGDSKDQTKKYVKIFSNMKRLPQLMQYYRTVQKTQLQQRWNETINLSENSNSFLYEYYEYLSENYQKQSKWCSVVFGPDAANEAIFVLIELLPSLQPTRETAILNVLKRSNEKLQALQEFSSANTHFVTTLYNQSDKPSSELKKKLSKAVFGYFNAFISQYPAIEQHFLATSLAGLNIMQMTVTETIRNLGTANKKVFEWANDSRRRCEKISQNCAIVPLATVLNSIFKSFMEKYKKAQQQLSASKTIEQNWSILQSCMSLLQHFGEFQFALKNFENEFTCSVLETYQKHFNRDHCGYRIIEKHDINELERMVKLIKETKEKNQVDNEYSLQFIIFGQVFEMAKPICSEIHDITLAAVFAPIEKQLIQIEPPETFNASGTELPDYSYAPQEFITQIGQYLLTLPQHLEPLLLSPSQSLKLALEMCDKKYKRNIPSADVLLSLVAEECCALYLSQILQIKTLSSTSAKQLAKDIEYIGNVLEEMGLTLTGQLQQTITLLRAAPESYLSLSSGCEPRLVTAIRQMRNIISTE